jgi:hypothetical protein
MERIKRKQKFGEQEFILIYHAIEVLLEKTMLKKLVCLVRNIFCSKKLKLGIYIYF